MGIGSTVYNAAAWSANKSAAAASMVGFAYGVMNLYELAMRVKDYTFIKLGVVDKDTLAPIGKVYSAIESAAAYCGLTKLRCFSELSTVRQNPTAKCSKAQAPVTDETHSDAEEAHPEDTAQEAHSGKKKEKGNATSTTVSQYKVSNTELFVRAVAGLSFGYLANKVQNGNAFATIKAEVTALPANLRHTVGF